MVLSGIGKHLSIKVLFGMSSKKGKRCQSKANVNLAQLVGGQLQTLFKPNI